jgi:hypothetical protein
VGEDGRDGADALEALRAEVERWQGEAARADARAAESVAESEALREQLRAANAASEQAGADITALQAQGAAAGERGRADAARYRELVLEAERELPEHLIAGDSIDEDEESRAAARAVVGRVRSQLEEQAQAARVPAGAPARGGPDTGAMTPEQKIRYGLSRRA